MLSHTEKAYKFEFSTVSRVSARTKGDLAALSSISRKTLKSPTWSFVLEHIVEVPNSQLTLHAVWQHCSLGL